MWLLLTAAFAAEPLATVDGVPIHAEDLAAARTQLDEATSASLDDARLLENLIITQLLVAEAEKRRVADTPAGKAALEQARRQALASAVVTQVLEERLDDAAVRAWYEAHPQEFSSRQVRARHILVATEAEADTLAGQLRAGADFATMAREHSIDTTSGVEGGELGWFEYEQMIPEFADVAFAGKPGEVLGPVGSRFGWHLILVQDSRDRVPFEEAAPRIRARLRTGVLEEWLVELESQAVVSRLDPVRRAEPVAVAPSVPGPSGRHRLVLVAWVDLQCPHCHEMHLALQDLARQRKDVRVVYRNYPLDQACNPSVSRGGHPLACDGARALVCAGEKSSLALDLLDQGDALDRAAIVGAGPRHGVSASRWLACLESPATAATLAEQVAEGARLGVEGTPTVYAGTADGWFRLATTPAELPLAIREIEGD